MKYNSKSIIINAHPELKLLPHGKWEQTWDIVLEKPITKKIKLQELSQELSSEDIFDKDYECDVQLEITEGKYIKVCVTLFRDDNPYHHDYSILAIYNMFNKMEKILGDFDTIQGQKMADRWIYNLEMRERRLKKANS